MRPSDFNFKKSIMPQEKFSNIELLYLSEF